MKVAVIPDSFKGTYTAQQLADAIADGLHDGGGDPIRIPGADGGEGTLAALTEALHLQHITIQTVGPWRNPITATYGLSPTGTAVIEVAAASGPTSALPWCNDVTVNRHELAVDIDAACRLSGVFTLRSGLTSDEYLDK